MKKKVIKINESDIERLVNKILKEEGGYKRSDLKPAIADVKGGRKMLVIVNKDKKVEAVGPEAKYLKNLDKDKICRIVDGIIEDTFDIQEDKEVLKELDTGDFSNIQIINFCDKRTNESKKLMGGLISEQELEEMVGWVIKEEKKNPNPCWKGYEMVGMKKKNGKEVPNCVPIDEVEELEEAEKRGD